MAIDDENILDGIGIDAENNALRLLLTDNLTWQESSSNNLSEFDHLMLLQNKINTYIAFLENQQYLEQYPDVNFNKAIIEIHFKYEISSNCENFLQTVQNQIGKYGILIEAHIN